MAGWSALFAGLGGVAIAFGLLAALISAFQPVGYLVWVWGNLVVGAVLLGSALVSSFDTVRDRMRSGEGRRAGKYGTSAVLSTLLGIAILGMLAFLSTRYSERFDWTEEKVHTLTDQTQQLLAGLDRDVTVTAFFSELDVPAVRDLLRRYDLASDRFTLDFVDPNTRPDLVEAMALDEEKLARGLVRFQLGDESVDLSEFSEDKITNALVSLTRSGDRKVYFLMGHNERAIEGEDAGGKEGFGQAADALRNENYRIAPLLIAQVGEVPEDADAVIVAGPTRSLPPEEQAALRRYLEGGGAVLAMIDPRANTNLGELLEEWGVQVGDDLIVDLELAFFQQYMSPFAGAYAAEHPITKKMGEQRNPTLFHLARSVQAVEGVDEFTTLVYTGEKSWAERDLDTLVGDGRFQYGEDDMIGPVPVAIAGTAGGASAGDGDTEGEDGEERSSGGRLVVIGDSDFATNEYMVRYGGNRDLFVNSINWLLGDVESISVRPHQARASRFTGSEEDIRAIQFLSLFVMPEAIAVMGVLAWWLRRKGPGR